MMSHTQIIPKGISYFIRYYYQTKSNKPIYTVKLNRKKISRFKNKN
jgi:hypothetical protein